VNERNPRYEDFKWHQKTPLTELFFLYLLDTACACVLVNASAEVPENRLKDFGIAVSDHAEVVRSQDICRFQNEASSWSSSSSARTHGA